MELSKVLSNIFNELVSLTEKLSTKELQSISNGDFKIELKIKTVKNKKKDIPLLSEDDVKIIIDKIELCKSRDEVLKYIDKRLKRELEEVALYLDISCSKSDKVDSIKQKIVESTVGARLRSKAIQGT